MSKSLDPLIQFHLQALGSLSDTDRRRAALLDSLSTLRFSEALERKLALSESALLPKQLVVVGPTQAGKSTLVNLLLGVDSAGASARAGFTVHCQGFAVTKGQFEWLSSIFPEGDQVEQTSLTRNVLGEYSCTYVGDDLHATIAERYSDSIIWDTPDFDSVSQSRYRNPVLQCAALADCVLMVVSKEKYADKSVWDMLKMLLIAGKEIIFVINKTPVDLREELYASVQSKLDALGNDAPITQQPEVVFVDESDNPFIELQQSNDVLDLRELVVSRLQSETIDAQRSALQQTARGYWREWTSALSAQHENTNAWREDVEQTCQSLLDTYDTEYLEHKRHDETLQLAVAELLVLLEIPGLAEPLTRIRNVVTWPMRKVLSNASKVETGLVKKDSRSEELRLLESFYDHSMTELSARISTEQLREADEQAWWQALQSDFSKAKPALKKGWQNETDNYQTMLKVETERAARSLYKKLEEQPAILNSLRAARVGGDAAAVVLAVKSGGLGAADLVIAPAVLSLTTMLTESALGQYMKKVQADLKRYQKKSVTALVNRKLKMKLHALAGASSPAISADELSSLARHYQIDNG